MSEAEAVIAEKIEPALKLNFISHGTLPSVDLAATRQFYEEFLGLEVINTSHHSMMIRLGGTHVYAVVHTKKPIKMPRLYHNGLDVTTDADVDNSFRIVNEQAEKWGLHDITKPVSRHGTYSFHFWDRDENSWEILSNPKGGYQWIFEKGDLEGLGHFQKNFRGQRPDLQGQESQ
jgi:catechol 2,3-dioxygenase-like lactoylglutathione lyase family enzyme